MKLLPPFLAFIFLASAAFSADLAALEVKGATFKKAKDGVPTEVNVGVESTFTPDDWRALGQVKTLTRASISPKVCSWNPKMSISGSTAP